MFASKHREIMADKLIELARQYGVDYFKLDFSNIMSPYGMMPYGCHSKEHAHHNDYSDAVFEQYQSMMFMRETVKAVFPDLIIDFSFEVFGTERPSIAALRYSELHHASNMNTLHPDLMRADHIRGHFTNTEIFCLTNVCSAVLYACKMKMTWKIF